MNVHEMTFYFNNFKKWLFMLFFIRTFSHQCHASKRVLLWQRDIIVMAMHRRVTMPNLGGGPPFAHNRAQNSLDQDRQDFERNQVNKAYSVINWQCADPIKLFISSFSFFSVKLGHFTINDVFSVCHKHASFPAKNGKILRYRRKKVLYVDAVSLAS